MIKGKEKVLETDAVIFPVKSAQDKQKKIFDEEPENKFVFEGEAIENNAGDRFARMKKALRKRSASIL